MAKAKTLEPQRPTGTEQYPHSFNLRHGDDFVDQLDEWRRRWDDLPSRSEVIRRLVKGESPPK